jgi:BirA family biotin operon repressor/biotin-[acetyl-CoA-carboxylase] ligase
MVVSSAHRITTPALLGLLADGRLHSGEELAAGLGVSRAAIWKGIERLRSLGIEVSAAARRGYQLGAALELLDAARIRQELAAQNAAVLRGLELSFEVDSTNTRLLEATPPACGEADACLCEVQHAGRGRRGRLWVAPFGASLAMSIAWVFRETARDLPALSLAVGVALTRALARSGAKDMRLKWPNDVWCNDRKVGGVLIELRAEAGGPAHVVIGIGLNIALSATARGAIDAAGSGVEPAAVADVCHELPSRNRLAGAILDELLTMLPQFERAGFSAFRDSWSAVDALQDRQVRVQMAVGSMVGRARGVDTDGALCVDVDGVSRRFVSGEVSLRLEGQAA